MMEKLEVERLHLTTKTSQSIESPAKLPIILRRKKFSSAGHILHDVLVGYLFHGEALLNIGGDRG